MQKITIKEITPSTAENKPTIIVDSTGAKMSGFDNTLKSLQPGDVIEAELEVKGKYTNIKEFKMISKATPAQVAEAQSQNGKEKQSEIIARAKNTALMQAVELAKADKIDLKEITNYADEFLGWLLGTKESTQAAPEPKKKPSEEKVSAVAPIEQEVTNPIEWTTERLLTWVAEAKAWKTAKTARSWLVNGPLKIKEERIDNEPEAVYNEIKDLIK